MPMPVSETERRTYSPGCQLGRPWQAAGFCVRYRLRAGQIQMNYGQTIEPLPGTPADPAAAELNDCPG